MDTDVKSILITAAVGLLSSGFLTLLIMWRDQALLKKDIDNLAEIIGTDRAKGRCRKNKGD